MSLIKLRAFSFSCLYDHNATMILLRKFRAVSFYCIATITTTQWSHWEIYEHSASTALLQSQWHDGLTEKAPSILFLLHCYDQNASMISLSKLRAFYFYCIVTIRKPRWSHWVNSEHSVFTALLTITMTRWSYWRNTEHSLSTSLLRSQWHDDHTE
jgi:hypothetical protein